MSRRNNAPARERRLNPGVPGRGWARELGTATSDMPQNPCLTAKRSRVCAYAYARNCGLISWGRCRLTSTQACPRGTRLPAPWPPLSGLGRALFQFCDLLAQTWWLWPALLALGWGFFEWRCKSENKGTFRLAGVAVAYLVTAAVVLVLSTAAMVMYTKSYCQMLCMEDPAASALSSCSVWPSARTPSRNSTPGITSFR